jgi:hypothetical protein
MPDYRIYKTTLDGRLLGPAAVIDCLDDREAIEQAVSVTKGNCAELWQGARLVSSFPGGGRL